MLRMDLYFPDYVTQFYKFTCTISLLVELSWHQEGFCPSYGNWTKHVSNKMGIIDNIVTDSTYMYITTTPIPLLAVNFP